MSSEGGGVGRERGRVGRERGRVGKCMVLHLQAVRIVTIYSKCLAFSGQKVPFWRSWNKMAVWLR